MPHVPTLPSPQDQRSRRSLVALGLFAACVAMGVLYWRYQGTLVESAQARVEGRSHTLAAPVSGRVMSVSALAGQDARQGEVLVAMDDAPLRAALTEAQAALEAARQGGVPSAAAGPANREAEESASLLAEQGRAEEKSARELLEHWTAEHARAMLALRSPASTAGPEREQAAADETAARQQVEAARRQLEDASRRRAAADAELRRVREAGRVLRPGPELVRLWQARVTQAEEDLRRASVSAPEAGRVVWLNVRTGQIVRRGDPLLTLAPVSPADGGVWVTAAFDRRQMLKLRVGQLCRVELEDGPALEGVIASLSPDAEGGLARVNLTEAAPGVWPGQGARVTVRTR